MQVALVDFANSGADLNGAFLATGEDKHQIGMFPPISGVETRPYSRQISKIASAMAADCLFLLPIVQGSLNRNGLEFLPNYYDQNSVVCGLAARNRLHLCLKYAATNGRKRRGRAPA